MVAEAAAAGQFDEPGFAPVPRIQIVTVEEAMRLHDRAVQLPARRDDAFKRAAREDTPQPAGQARSVIHDVRASLNIRLNLIR